MLPLTLLLALAAPVPKHRPPPPFDPAGGWRSLSWHGSSGPAGFHRDGTFGCLWQGQWWGGVWELRGDTLHVWCWPAGGWPDSDSPKVDQFNWPLQVGRRGPGWAEGETRGGGRWRMER